MNKDGINSMVEYEKMSVGAKKMRDFYGMKKNAGIYQKEFGFYSMDLWKSQGYIKDGDNLDDMFGFDPQGKTILHGLGWCEAEFYPPFEEVQIEDRGEHEVVQDFAGRHVLYFKNRRHGFMPEYLDHPVKDFKDRKSVV